MLSVHSAVCGIACGLSLWAEDQRGDKDGVYLHDKIIRHYHFGILMVKDPAISQNGENK